ncbi:hypothetical protein HDU87_006596 [Geranomyces variabilis]|uniref:Uncharacterized protein n=1 Tax=Geranomyces variabilis TaxID=109894 RepID=A0AAD5XK96_9FUNG|nr:hypothetical protein HDU87_006596 [Geranomyces variabilis]
MVPIGTEESVSDLTKKGEDGKDVSTHLAELKRQTGRNKLTCSQWAGDLIHRGILAADEFVLRDAGDIKYLARKAVAARTAADILESAAMRSLVGASRKPMTYVETDQHARNHLAHVGIIAVAPAPVINGTVVPGFTLVTKRNWDDLVALPKSAAAVVLHTSAKGTPKGLEPFIDRAIPFADVYAELHKNTNAGVPMPPKDCTDLPSFWARALGVAVPNESVESLTLSPALHSEFLAGEQEVGLKLTAGGRLLADLLLAAWDLNATTKRASVEGPPPPALGSDWAGGGGGGPSTQLRSNSERPFWRTSRTPSAQAGFNSQSHG